MRRRCKTQSINYESLLKKCQWKLLQNWMSTFCKLSTASGQNIDLLQMRQANYRWYIRAKSLIFLLQLMRLLYYTVLDGVENQSLPHFLLLLFSWQLVFVPAPFRAAAAPLLPQMSWVWCGRSNLVLHLPNLGPNMEGSEDYSSTTYRRSWG